MAKHYTITINVAYDEDSVPADMESALHYNVQHAIGQGLFDDPRRQAIVDTWDVSVSDKTGTHTERRINLLLESLRSATSGPRGSASPQNYSVWDGERELETGLSRDEAIGFARGLDAVGLTYNGFLYNAEVRCGAFVVWPEERYGVIVGEDE